MRVKTTASERLKLILAGRKPFGWRKAVALSAGAMQRLSEGKFPDPEKLIPACRVENINLNWWLDGAGNPYFVYIAANPHHHTRIADQILADEPRLQPVVCSNGADRYGAFIQPITSTSVDGIEYSYRAVSIIGGSPSEFLVEAMCEDHGVDRAIHELPMTFEKLQRLASGEMGSYEFLREYDASHGQLLKVYTRRARMVAEPAPPVTTEQPVADELAAQIARLDEAGRMKIERLLKARRGR